MIQKEVKMVAHPKLKRTQKKGYRSSSPDTFPYMMEVHEAREWLGKILSNNQLLNDQDLFRLTQFLKVAQWHFANSEAEKKQLYEELESREDEGLRKGLNVAKIRAINRLTLDLKEEELLESFLEKVKTRIGAK